MLRFEKVEGPLGIPIYYEKLPDFIRNSAISLVVFTGSADDLSVGEPGLYHWFEHVPFRGTKKFPNGYSDTFGRISKLGGNLNANTSPLRTVYLANIPTRYLDTAFEVVTSLVAEPLISPDGVERERDIIKQEIGRRLSDVNGFLHYRLGSLLFPTHPFRNHTLGTIESLDAMSPEVMLEAREKGYCVSRMAFFVSTSLGLSEVMGLAEANFKTLPQNNLSERRKFASHGEVTWSEKRRHVIKAEFSTSFLKVLFPLPPIRTWEEDAEDTMLGNVFGYSGPGSPLSRTIREERQLSYEVGMSCTSTLDLRYVGFQMKLERKNLEEAEKALIQMLREDSQLRSREWFDSIKESRRNKLDMEIISPGGRVSSAVGAVGSVGTTIHNDDYHGLIEMVSHDKVLAEVEKLATQEPYVIIVEGK